jgi:TolB protein
MSNHSATTCAGKVIGVRERKHSEKRGRTLGPALILTIICCAAGGASGKLIIDVGSPDLARMPFAAPDFSSSEPGPVSGRDLAEIFRNDLRFTGLFDLVIPRSAVPATAPSPDFDAWTRLGAQALLVGAFQTSGEKLVVEARLYDTALKKLESAKRFSGKLQDHRLIMHKISDRALQSLTGVPGCFSSRIAFVGTGRSRDLFVMDYDGRNLRQLTRNGAVNLSPEWSPDGKEILFTSYIQGPPRLFAVDAATGAQRIVSAHPGLNVAARYSPDGSRIALSLNHHQIPKLFIITPQGNILKLLTEGRGNDISPSWSPDQSALAFVSDQSGRPQIYIVPSEGGVAKRVTFDTEYSTDPDWSPRGDVIAFTARIGGRFQICVIRTDGTDQRILTEKGSNTDPAWSPDGRMIAFTSDRDGEKRIFVMDARGGSQVPVSQIPGKSPAWSRKQE